jgi:hypothetical protein
MANYRPVLCFPNGISYGSETCVKTQKLIYEWGWGGGGLKYRKNKRMDPDFPLYNIYSLSVEVRH